MADTQGHFSYRGQLKGHGGWVTSIACPADSNDSLLSGSRDGSLIQWEVSPSPDFQQYGVAKKRLEGHSNFVQDVQISYDGHFGLSASWDGSLRLWDLSTGVSTCRFVGHEKDAMSCGFSPDNRQIISGSRDKSIRVWNTLGECKYTITDEGHTEWVSCVRFSPSTANPLIVSAGWDKVVKIWNLANCKLRTNLFGHQGYLNTVTVSPDGSICASGGKDGTANLWDLNEGKRLYSLVAGDIIHSLVFSPNRYWLCAATSSGIKIWDLESKIVVHDLQPEFELPKGKLAQVPHAVSLAWSADGSVLFSGYTDGVIRVWAVGN